MKIILSRTEKPAGSIHCGVANCECHNNDWQAEIDGSSDGAKRETAGSPGEALQWLLRDHADALGFTPDAAEGLQVLAWDIKKLYQESIDASEELIELFSAALEANGIVVVRT